jgi:hypothetical protein
MQNELGGIVDSVPQYEGGGRNYRVSAPALLSHMWLLHLHGFHLHGKERVTSWPPPCERTIWALLFCFSLLSYSLTARFRLCQIHKHRTSLRRFATSASSSSSFLPCLPACLALDLSCHYQQLHLTTAATMGKRKPSDAEVEGVQAKNTKKSKITMNIGMFLISFTCYSRCFALNREGWQGWLLADAWLGGVQRVFHL